jgi:two-component system, OmpR family, phosphate regulon sensor histidine kinase PhoR
MLPGRAGEVEVSGIGERDRPWTIVMRKLQGDDLLVRMIDRSSHVAAEKMRVDFVANASHELRTPLSTILGYAETLADDSDIESELRSKFAEVIGSEAKRMLRIVEDLMSLSRIEADRFVTPRELVDVRELVESVVRDLAPVCQDKGCTVETDIADELPPIPGDKTQLLQLLDNLVSNAVRYGCGDRGCNVIVEAKPANGRLRLSVRDDGVGIPGEHLPRLTERFYRVDSGRSRASGGTGLGLAIVKHIVERHKGSLDISSEVGQGTNVVVWLPMAG